MERLEWQQQQEQQSEIKESLNHKNTHHNNQNPKQLNNSTLFLEYLYVVCLRVRKRRKQGW